MIQGDKPDSPPQLLRLLPNDLLHQLVLLLIQLMADQQHFKIFIRLADQGEQRLTQHLRPLALRPRNNAQKGSVLPAMRLFLCDNRSIILQIQRVLVLNLSIQPAKITVQGGVLGQPRQILLQSIQLTGHILWFSFVHITFLDL